MLVGAVTVPQPLVRYVRSTLVLPAPELGMWGAIAGVSPAPAGAAPTIQPFQKCAAVAPATAMQVQVSACPYVALSWACILMEPGSCSQDARDPTRGPSLAGAGHRAGRWSALQLSLPVEAGAYMYVFGLSPPLSSMHAHEQRPCMQAEMALPSRHYLYAPPPLLYCQPLVFVFGGAGSLGC